MHGANSTLNEGVTGLSLRASVVVGYRGGEREEREREEKGDGSINREEKKETKEKRKENLFGEGEHTAF